MTPILRVWKTRSLSEDPEEGEGVLQIEIAIEVRRGADRVTHHRRSVHHFRVGRVSPGPDLAALGLLVLLPPDSLAPGLEGSLVFAPSIAAPVSVFEMLDRGPAEGTLGGVPPDKRSLIGRLVRDVLPGALEGRAHFVFESPGELSDFLHTGAERRVPVDGIVHCTFEEPFELTVPPAEWAPAQGTTPRVAIASTSIGFSIEVFTSSSFSVTIDSGLPRSRLGLVGIFWPASLQGRSSISKCGMVSRFFFGGADLSRTESLDETRREPPGTHPT